MDESELRHLYLEEQLTETEIGARFGLSQRQVSYMRHKYKVPTLTKSDRFGLKPLTAQQKALLLGSMVGDGRLFTTGSSTAAFSEFHSTAQIEYLQWKAGIWDSYICSVRNGDSTKNGRTYTGKILRTYASKEFRVYCIQFN